MHWIAAGPSRSGKGWVFVYIILNCFSPLLGSSVYFSPTAVLDKTWDPVQKHLQEDMGIDLKKGTRVFFETWDDGATLDRLVEKHPRVVRKQKERGDKHIFGACFVVDGKGDRADVLHKAYGVCDFAPFFIGTSQFVFSYSWN